MTGHSSPTILDPNSLNFARDNQKALTNFRKRHPDVLTVHPIYTDYSGAYRCRGVTMRQAAEKAEEALTNGQKRDAVSVSKDLSVDDPLEEEGGDGDDYAYPGDRPDIYGVVYRDGGPALYGWPRFGFESQVTEKRMEANGFVPDWMTALVSAYDPRRCHVLGWMTSEFDRERYGGNPFASDPRWILSKVVKMAKDEYGLEFYVGWENEFSVFKDRKDLETVDTQYTLHSVQSTRTREYTDICEGSARFLEANGVPVAGFHAEGGYCQGLFEIALRQGPTLLSTDNLVKSTTVTKDKTAAHGHFATMHPNPTVGAQIKYKPHAGRHLHLSFIHTPKECSKESPKDKRKRDTELGDQFIAGALAKLAEATAFYLGGYDSYYADRSLYYGGPYVYWGIEKFSPIGRISSTHFELRIPDALSSPYLQVAAFIVTGLEGIRKKMTLPEPSGWNKVSKMSLEEKQQRFEPLPGSLGEAIDLLEKNQPWWQERLGGYCVDGYIGSRRKEIESATAKNDKGELVMSDEQRRQKVFDNV